MSSIKKKLQLFNLLAISSIMNPEQFGTSYSEIREAKNHTQKNKQSYKGQKEYFFNSSGEFSNEKMQLDECVFSCYAINDKNAKKKFNKR